MYVYTLIYIYICMHQRGGLESTCHKYPLNIMEQVCCHETINQYGLEGKTPELFQPLKERLARQGIHPHPGPSNMAAGTSSRSNDSKPLGIPKNRPTSTRETLPNHHGKKRSTCKNLLAVPKLRAASPNGDKHTNLFQHRLQRHPAQTE